MQIDLDSIDWKWVATLILALYGALLSTWREVQSRREHKPKIRVVVKPNADVILDGVRTRGLLQIRAENVGRVPVTFDKGCLSVQMMDDHANFLVLTKAFSETKLPATLAPGTAIVFTGSQKDLIEGIDSLRVGSGVPMRAVVIDSIRRNHVSDWMPVPRQIKTSLT